MATRLCLALISFTPGAITEQISADAIASFRALRSPPVSMPHLGFRRQSGNLSVEYERRTDMVHNYTFYDFRLPGQDSAGL